MKSPRTKRKQSFTNRAKEPLNKFKKIFLSTSTNLTLLLNNKNKTSNRKTPSNKNSKKLKKPLLKSRPYSQPLFETVLNTFKFDNLNIFISQSFLYLKSFIYRFLFTHHLKNCKLKFSFYRNND